MKLAAGLGLRSLARMKYAVSLLRSNKTSVKSRQGDVNVRINSDLPLNPFIRVVNKEVDKTLRAELMRNKCRRNLHTYVGPLISMVYS